MEHKESKLTAFRKGLSVIIILWTAGYWGVMIFGCYAELQIHGNDDIAFGVFGRYVQGWVISFMVLAATWIMVFLAAAYNERCLNCRSTRTEDSTE